MTVQTRRGHFSMRAAAGLNAQRKPIPERLFEIDPAFRQGIAKQSLRRVVIRKPPLQRIDDRKVIFSGIVVVRKFRLNARTECLSSEEIGALTQQLHGRNPLKQDEFPPKDHIPTFRIVEFAAYKPGNCHIQP